jgi:hypothetical protein
MQTQHATEPLLFSRALVDLQCQQQENPRPYAFKIGGLGRFFFAS